MAGAGKASLSLRAQTGVCPPPWGPHLSEVSSLAVLHGQQGQVIGSQVLHPLGDIPRCHHTGVVQPRRETSVREGPGFGHQFSHCVAVQLVSLQRPGTAMGPQVQGGSRWSGTGHSPPHLVTQ